MGSASCAATTQSPGLAHPWPTNILPLWRRPKGCFPACPGRQKSPPGMNLSNLGRLNLSRLWAEHQLKANLGKTLVFRAMHFFQQTPSAQVDAINPVHCDPIQARNESPDHEPPHLAN